MIEVTNHKTMKRQNRTNILSLIRECSGVSQAELAVETGLRPSTVSYAVRELRDLSLVHSVGRGVSAPGGGKPSVTLAVNPNAGRYIALSLRCGRIDLATVDFSGTVTHQASIANLDTGDALVESAFCALRETINGLTYPLFGIGVAAASVVSREGTVLPSAAFPFTLPDFATVISRECKISPTVPVIVENDANCAALTKAVAGETTLALILSSAPVTVGAGMAIDGSIYHGAKRSAGEIVGINDTTNPDGLREVLTAVLRFADPATVVFVHDTDSSVWPTDPSLLVDNAELAGRRIEQALFPAAPLAGAIRLIHDISVPNILGEQ